MESTSTQTRLEHSEKDKRTGNLEVEQIWFRIETERVRSCLRPRHSVSN